MNTLKNILKLTGYALPIVLGTTLCLAQTTMDFVGGFGWGNPYHNYCNYASTAAEGYGRGLGDIIRSKGAYNLMTSQAAINATEAIRNDIQNRELGVNAYFQMRKDQRAGVAEERGPRPTTDDLLRYSQMNKPKPLGPNQLDAVSGKIYWPRLLRTDQFASSRGVLEELMVKRTRYGDISMEDLMKIREETNKMINQLNGEIRDIPPMEYASAKQFLSSLAYEVQIVAS
jgi:hypothetical protein